jgi:predicted site-specific integrase-resolvase
MWTLKDYAKQHGIKYRAAWNRYKRGLIPEAIKDEFGKIIIPENTTGKPSKVVCYARVSSTMNKQNLETQAERLISYANAKGLKVDSVVKEIGSGLNDARPKLMRLLTDVDVTHIIVEHKDRLTRFGFRFIDEWLKEKQVILEVINKVDSDKEDLLQDFVSLVTSFTARLYGLRRSRRKTEQLIKELSEKEE